MSIVDHRKVIKYDKSAPEKIDFINNYLISNIDIPSMKVEHIGSSSVPGLGGKRVIDVMIAVGKNEMSIVVEKLHNLGHPFNSKQGTGTFEDRYFVSDDLDFHHEKIHVHFHITYFNSEDSIKTITFRNYLRNNKKEANHYFKLKKKWMRESNYNLIEFTKSMFFNFFTLVEFYVTSD